MASHSSGPTVIAPAADLPDWALRTVDLCLLYTSDAADERSSVDLGGRRIIKKKKIAVIDGRHQLHAHSTAAQARRE